MIKRVSGWRRWAGWALPGAMMLQLGGGCGLSDSQLSSIVTSLVSTGLNTLVTQFITSLVDATGGAA